MEQASLLHDLPEPLLHSHALWSPTRWQRRYSFPQIYLAEKHFLPRASQRTSVVQEISEGNIGPGTFLDVFSSDISFLGVGGKMDERMGDR